MRLDIQDSAVCNCIIVNVQRIHQKLTSGQTYISLLILMLRELILILLGL